MKKCIILTLLGILVSCSNISTSSVNTSSNYETSSSNSTSERLPYPDKIVVEEGHNTLNYDFGIQYKKYHNQKLYAKCSFHETLFNFKDYNVPDYYHIAGDYKYIKYKGAYESDNSYKIANYNYMYFIGEIYEVLYERAKCILIEDNLISRDENGFIKHISMYENFEYIVIKVNNEFIPLNEYNGDKIYVTLGAKDNQPYALYSFDPTKESPTSENLKWEWSWD